MKEKPRKSANGVFISFVNPAVIINRNPNIWKKLKKFLDNNGELKPLIRLLWTFFCGFCRKIFMIPTNLENYECGSLNHEMSGRTSASSRRKTLLLLFPLWVNETCFEQIWIYRDYTSSVQNTKQSFCSREEIKFAADSKRFHLNCKQFLWKVSCFQ